MRLTPAGMACQALVRHWPMRHAERQCTIVRCLQDSPSKQVGKKWSKPWFIFNDACFEAASECWSCGIGGILYDAKGVQISAFRFGLSAKHLKVLGFPGKRTVIFQAELLAVIVALWLWAGPVGGAPRIPYIDNNSARDVTISENARSQPAAAFVETLLML